MSVEDAQEAFHDVYTAVFKNETDSPETRALILENEIKKLLDARKLPHTKRMFDFSSPGSSKVALCYSPTARMDSYKFFRNYQSPQQITQDVTVIEAIKATWASTGILPPISIGPKGREETVVSAGSAFANPIREVIKEVYHVFGAKARVSCLLSLGSGFGGVLAFEDGTNVVQGARIDCERVAREVKQALAKSSVYYRLSVDRGLERWGPFITEFGAMKSHVDDYLGRDGDMDQCVTASTKAGSISMERIYAPKAQENRSRQGIPPLSAYFVMRRKPMNAIIKGLVDGDVSTQRIMVISGLGGSGKTQLTISFARDFQERYQHIFFIDSSSKDSIEKGLISRVRSMRAGRKPTTVDDALETLSNPDEEYHKDWFIIFDNADDPATPLSNYFPACDHGSILITTRNPTLRHLSPGAHLELGNMDEDEAVEALLSSAFPPGQSVIHTRLVEETANQGPTDRDREAAVSIVKELECLPIAVVQAGCYIQQHKVLHRYLDRLRTNRSDLLQRTTLAHRDRLKYPHGVYASFDIVLQALSPRALQLLGVLSFFHFSNFPRSLFAIAAKSKFAYEFLELMDRPSEFHQAIRFLNDMLCPNGKWNEAELDGLLEDLQKYSLVTIVPIHNMIILRFHPLVHSWAHDRLSTEEKVVHSAAAVRLFVCGITKYDDEDIWEYLLPHFSLFSTNISDLHVNDQAAISFFYKPQTTTYLNIWMRIHEVVEAKYGPQHVRTSRALLQLADAYGSCGDEEKMEVMERNIIAILDVLLGRDHPQTAAARANLARTLRQGERYVKAEALEKEVLRVYIRTWGLYHRDTAQGMIDLATTYRFMGRRTDEEKLLSGVVAILTKVAGRATRSTIRPINQLAQCHYTQGQHTEAERLRKEALILQQELHGEHHLNTVESMAWLAWHYSIMGRYQDAEPLMRVEVETRRRIQGYQHFKTLSAINSLATLYERLERYEEVELLRKEELAGHRATKGDTDDYTLDALDSLAYLYEKQGRYEEAEELRKEKLAGHRATVGDTDYDTLDAIDSLANLYEKQGRYEEAEQLWKEKLESLRVTEGDTDFDTLDAVDLLARFYERQERYEEAEKLWKEELAGRRATGDTVYDTLNAIHSLAKSYEKQGDMRRRSTYGRSS